MASNLNLFRFFNNKETEYYEDNLSRAFALCLRNDPLFFSKIIETLVDQDTFNELFFTEYPNDAICIDLQKSASSFLGTSKIISVSCSEIEISPEQFRDIEPRVTKSPEIDVSIQVRDLTIIFEFKRVAEDCSAQLKNQALRICEHQQINFDSSVRFCDLNWQKILKLSLNVISLEKQIKRENIFIADFIELTEAFQPDWFPMRLLSSLQEPRNEQDPKVKHIEKRMIHIRNDIYGKESTEEVGGRHFIKVNKGWTQELHVVSRFSGGKYVIAVEFYIGDTKAQGEIFFGKNKEYMVFPESVAGYDLITTHYIKFSAFSSYLFWLEPDGESVHLTHNYNFFQTISGRYEKPSWPDFEQKMSLIKGWKSKCEWNEKIINSNRTRFDISVGIRVGLEIPYHEACKLDTSKDNSNLSWKIKEILDHLLSIIK